MSIKVIKINMKKSIAAEIIFCNETVYLIFNKKLNYNMYATTLKYLLSYIKTNFNQNTIIYTKYLIKLNRGGSI